MRIEFGTRVAFAATLLVAACGGDGDPTDVTGSALACSIPKSQIFDGGPGKDGIPALIDPKMVDADDSHASYLRPADRVIGFLIGGQAYAVPLNIGWWHEIINLDLGGQRIAVTHCPLTGSSLAFDRSAAGGATFGVSGLLFNNNLIMYDRNQPESLWPQMVRGARCGSKDGVKLTMFPIVEMEWNAWRTLHGQTLVVSDEASLFRNYTQYPYGSYDRPGNEQLLFPMNSIDRRRPMKERVLGIPELNGGGVGFPYGVLDGIGAAAVVNYDAGAAGQLVVLWDRFAQAAMAFSPIVDGTRLDLEVRAGAIVDKQTASTWDVDGFARSGPLKGKRLEPVAEAYIAFWFAWASFHPQAQLWQGAST